MPEDLLFLSGHVPAERSRQAGHKTAFRHLRWFAERYRVRLLAFRSEADQAEDLEPLRALCVELCVLDVTRASRWCGIMQHPALPLLVASRQQDAAHDQLRRWSREIRFARVHAEWAAMGAYLKHFSAVSQRSLYLHDVLSQWARRRARRTGGILWRAEAWRARRWERAVYRWCTRILVPSTKDAALVRGHTHSARVEVLPLHIDRYGTAQERPSGPPWRLLFWGALGREENAAAARWLVREVLPRVRSAAGPFQLTLLGSNPPPDLRNAVASDLEVPGFVADPGPWFDRAHLAVLPLFEGAGVKVKVLECLAAGIPVLTTEIGAEGIAAEAVDGLCVLPPRAEAFVEALHRWTVAPAELAGLTRAARDWAGRATQAAPGMLFGD